MESTIEANPRLAFRMTLELKECIEQAAALMGVTVTEFVTSTLAEKAMEVVGRQHSIILSDRDRDRFLAALARSGQPLPELAATIKRHQTRLSMK